MLNTYCDNNQIMIGNGKNNNDNDDDEDNNNGCGDSNDDGDNKMMVTMLVVIMMMMTITIIVFWLQGYKKFLFYAFLLLLKMFRKVVLKSISNHYFKVLHCIFLK